jgi:hypothetical protein
MTAPDPVPQIALNDGRSIPQLGFGVWQLQEVVALRVVPEFRRHEHLGPGHDRLPQAAPDPALVAVPAPTVDSISTAGAH